MLPRLDHLVWAVPDLDAAVAAVAADWGVRPAMGGSHPGYGTRNALLGLSADSYLELIGPDPAQPGALGRSPFGLADLRAPRLVAWFMAHADVDAIASVARQWGLGAYDPFTGARVDGRGRRLEWRMAAPGITAGDPVPPFLIGWGDTPHPAASAPAGCALRSFQATHPDARRLMKEIAALGWVPDILAGDSPSLSATIATPRGDRTL